MKSTKRIVGTKKRKDGSKQERLSEEMKAEKLKRGKKATGRPSTYFGGDIWWELLSRLQEGQSLKKICELDHMPSRQQVLRKTSQDKDFAIAYARARLDAADAVFDGIIDEIRDTRLRGDPVEGSRLKLLIDTQKWVLSHVNPRKYADKIDFSPDEGKRPARVMILGANDEEPNNGD